MEIRKTKHVSRIGGDEILIYLILTWQNSENTENVFYA